MVEANKQPPVNPAAVAAVVASSSRISIKLFLILTFFVLSFDRLVLPVKVMFYIYWKDIQKKSVLLENNSIDKNAP